MNPLEKIFLDLHVSQDIQEKINSSINPYDPESLLSIASSLASSFSIPNSRKLAGAIYMLVSLRSCPKKISNYVMGLSHLLSEDLMRFLLENEREINEILDRKYYKNYELDYFSAVNMVKSYLMAQSCGNRPRMESPILMSLRIASFLFCRDGVHKVLSKSKEMILQKYTHASPTIFNGGTKRPQCASCFLTDIKDDLESIVYRGIGDMAIISKNMGGLGINMNKIRHSQIGFSGESSGPLPYAIGYDRIIGNTNQGGRRSGNATFFVRDWNIDVMGFIEASSTLAPPQLRFENAVTCIWTSNLFLKRVRNDENWTLFCPAHVDGMSDLYLEEFESKYHYFEKLAVEREEEHLILKKKLAEIKERYLQNPEDNDLRNLYYQLGQDEAFFEKNKLIRYKVVRARDVWQKICLTQMRRAIYIMNCDKINAACNMSNIYVVNNSNLCTEIIQPCPGNEISSCNLASLNLKYPCLKKIDWRKSFEDNVTAEDLRQCYDFEDLGKTVRSVVENLNRVIDNNYYPLDTITETEKISGPISTPNKRNRPLGIGVSGLNDAFLNLNLIFSSKAAALLNKMIFACMYFNALIESLKLSIEEGEYSSFRTGTCKVYRNGQWETIQGSPLSNGYFQFDLWQFYTNYMRDKGVLKEMSNDNEDNFENEGSDFSTYGIFPGEKVYDIQDDLPLDPTTWGQKPIVISTHNRRYFPITVTIEPTWESLRQAIIQYGVRNSMLLAVMPTASSASVLGNTENTEAHQQLIYSRSVKDGQFLIAVPQLEEDLSELGLWNEKTSFFIKGCNGSISMLHSYVKDFPTDFVPTEENWEYLSFLQQKHRGMFEISQKVFIQQARQRGIYVDQSQSLNLYLAEPTLEILSKMHHYSSACFLKTNIYYLRQAPDRNNAKLGIPAEIRRYIETIEEFDEDDQKSSSSSETPESQEDFVCMLEEGCVMCSS